MENNKNFAVHYHIHYHDGEINRDGQCFKLDPRQIQLLDFFLAHPDQVVSRTTLTEQVWQSAYTSDDTINTTVSKLRRALGDQRDLFIVTVPKKGYRFSISEQVSLKLGPVKVEPVKTELEQPVKVDKPDANLSYAPNSSTNPIDSNHSWLTKLIITLPIVIVMVTLANNNWSSNQPKQLPNKEINNINKQKQTKGSTATKQNQPILLAISDIEIAATDNKANKQIAEVLRDQIAHELSMVKGINIVSHQGTQNHKRQAQQRQTQAEQAILIMHAKLLLFDKTAKLTLQLNHLADGARVFSTVIDTSIINKQTLLTQLGKQAVAAIKSQLLHPNLFKRYAPALKHLTHVELEQLIVASNHVKKSMPKTLEKALTILNTLNRNNPNTSQVLGLLASAHIQARARLNGYYLSSTPKIRQFAEQALALEPSNLNALQALGSYYMHTPHLKDKAYHVFNAMLRYHPDETISWRYQLYAMVRDARSCNDIRSFVASIPKGLFAPARLKVIGNILDSCDSLTPTKQIEKLWLQRTMDINGRTHKSLPNNFNLFDRMSDFTVEIKQNELVHRTGPRMNMNMYRIQMAIGNVTGARNIYEDFKGTASDYWLTTTDFITQAHNQTSSAKQPTFRAQDYPFLDICTNFYLVITLLKNNRNKNTRADAQRALKAYLQHMPVFPVGLNSRYESIALMMAQRAAGKIEQAQQTASRLSKHLRRYRENSPQSYYFWRLGSIQLISDFYCGHTCQPLTLTQLFEPSHRWWTDDISIMSAALEPWAEDPLVKEYLSKIENDRVRVRARLGM